MRWVVALSNTAATAWKPGEREITWSVKDYASGLYLCRLIAHGDDGRRGETVVKMAVSQ